MLERNVCEGQWPTPNDTKVIKGCLGTVFFGPPCTIFLSQSMYPQ